MIERCATALEQEARRGAKPLALPRQPASAALELRVHRELEPSSRRGEHGVELGEIRHDERAGCGRRRRARVGGEVAERRVLLVTDRRHDGDAGGGDGAHDGLVAEREEVLEAPAAAGEHDDVHLGVRGQRCERGDDRVRGALALHARLAHDDPRRRESRTDRRDEVAASRGVRTGEDPDRTRDAWQPALPLGREEPLRGELPLQLLERDEVAAEADPLDRGRAEPELPSELVELGASGDVNGLALLEAERRAGRRCGGRWSRPASRRSSGP